MVENVGCSREVVTAGRRPQPKPLKPVTDSKVEGMSVAGTLNTED